MKKEIMTSFKMFLVMTAITGILYPLGITAIGQVIFPHQANGSIIKDGDKLIGSKLIGQKFTSDKYFWGRPSACDYGTVASGASNLGPTSKALKDAVEERKKDFIKKNSLAENTTIPKEMLFASGSGVDPHVSVETVKLQVERVVTARKFGNDKKEILVTLIDKVTEKPQFGILGETRINILLLNQELDKI